MPQAARKKEENKHKMRSHYFMVSINERRYGIPSLQVSAWGYHGRGELFGGMYGDF